uniref:Hyccin n=1 Tax=Syphacia muris TaxID=451379 RepID=A0A0N5ARX2_9BILA
MNDIANRVMNSEQLQDWLTVVNEEFKGDEKAVKEIDSSRGLLFKQVEKSHYLINFLYSSYSDVNLTQPILAQLLASYYRGGILRYFALQFLPCLIHVYLLVLAKRQRKSVSMLETFLTAVYNEEILVRNAGDIEKKVEEVRIPSLRYPSVYHDPKRLNVGPEILQLRPTSPVYVQKTVRIGPYDTIEKVTAENRPIVLTRLLKAVNVCLRHLPEDVVCRYLCSSTNAICHSGFSFGESDFVSRLLQDAPITFTQDYSRKPRIHLSSQYLLEALNGVYFSLFNGSFEIKMMAVRVIDAVHQRAVYEMFADVTLVTNSVRSSLLEKSFFQNEELAAMKRSSFITGGRKRNELVTNASLRLKKMPEDIVVTDDDEVNGESPHRKDSSFVEGSLKSMRCVLILGFENLKKKVAQKVEQSRVKGECWLEQQKARSGSFLQGARRWKRSLMKEDT